MVLSDFKEDGKWDEVTCFPLFGIEENWKEGKWGREAFFNRDGEKIRKEKAF